MRSALLTALGLFLAAPGALAAPAAEPPPAESLRAVCDELRGAAANPRDVDLALAELKKQAAAIAAARQELKSETARLTGLIATAVEAQAKAEEAKKPAKPKPQIERLAKTISSMKPAKSAAMMIKLPQPLAVSALARLLPARRAAILEKMTPDRAAELLHALSELPQPEDDEADE
jgi:flagellar motility protein MotE (MotC chaperone)